MSSLSLFCPSTSHLHLITYSPSKTISLKHALTAKPPQIHRTTSIPDNPHLPFTDLHGRKLPLSTPDTVTCRIVDFPPVPADTADKVNFMHRTLSTDYGVVLDGKIVLVMDSGEEVVCERGDVVVQRGTNHAWRNVFEEVCRVMFVLVPSEGVRVEATGEVLKPTDTRHLTDEGVTERV